MADVLPAIIPANKTWANNGELIADIVRLKILDLEVPTLDPTYEGGLWWTVVRPTHLTGLHRPTDGTDFRHLDYPDGSWRQIAYDPPYCAMGGKKTSTMAEYNERYGRDVVESDPESVQRLINDGLTEMWRLLAPGGVCLVKLQDYVWNAEIWLATHWTMTHALELGFIVEERFEMGEEAGAQPKRSTCRHCGASIQRRKDHETWTDLKRSGDESAVCRRPHYFRLHEPTAGLSTQDHAYRNHSTMLCLRKPTRAGFRPRQYLRGGYPYDDPRREDDRAAAERRAARDEEARRAARAAAAHAQHDLFGGTP